MSRVREGGGALLPVQALQHLLQGPVLLDQLESADRAHPCGGLIAPRSGSVTTNDSFDNWERDLCFRRKGGAQAQPRQSPLLALLTLPPSTQRKNFERPAIFPTTVLSAHG